MVLAKSRGNAFISRSTPAWLAAVALAAGGAAAEQQPRVDPGKVLVLHRAGPWRVLYSWTLPQVQAAGGIQPRILKSAREVTASDMAGFDFLTEFPPTGWTEPDFNDAVWPRYHYFRPFPSGETDGRAGGGGASYYTRQISLRGKFNVVDPAQAGRLTLRLAYRGGAVVYLNGKEIARGHLPEGKLESGALAEAYPANVWFKPDGKLISWYTDRPDLDRVTPERVRTLEHILLPAAQLRKGHNVVAVEIHSAPYPAVFLNYRNPVTWVPCGLVELALEADRPDGIEPNVARPRGVQAWNADIQETVHNVDWGNPLEPLGPISLLSGRNGWTSGQLVLGSDQPLEDVSASVTALRGPGASRIPAAAVRISYGFFAGVGSRGALYGGVEAMRADGMVDAPPASVPLARVNLPQPFVAGAVQPIYVSVHVPKDAAAGTYEGTLRVKAADGFEVQAPLRLRVANWTIPDPVDFSYWCGMVEAPEGPACRYQVPLWSERHWQLIGKSFDWLAQLGPRVLFIPLAAQTELGNAEGMVRFKTAADGAYAADVSLVEKYLDVALQHLGKPRYVVCGLWQMREQKTPGSPWDNPSVQGGPMITVVGADGQIQTIRGPGHATPESTALWQPVLTRIDAMLARKGLAGTLVLGFCDDVLPNEATAAAYKKIVPRAGWYAGRHMSNLSVIPSSDGAVPIVYQGNVYGAGDVPDPAKTRYYGWNRKYPVPGGLQVWVDRSVYDAASPAKFRWLPEAMLMSDRPGQGAIGADFWPPPPAKGTFALATIFSRYPRSANVGGGGKGITTTQLLYPGPAGAVPTVRFEMMREGIQEAEARVFLERLLLEDPRRLREDLAAKAQELLDLRARWARRHLTFWCDEGVVLSPLVVPYSGWQQRTMRLYELAAEAVAASGNLAR
jgi:hypothetical protein